MALVYVDTKTKNLPDSGAWQIHKFGSAAGEQRIALEGNWETDPNVFDFFVKDVDFYFFTKSDMLDYIASIQEEIYFPTQNYRCTDYPSFYNEKVKEIENYPDDVIVLRFEKNPRAGGTAYIASVTNEDSDKYNFLRSICLSSSKQGRNNAYTTFHFIKYQDTSTGKYIINLLPIFSKKYSMEELSKILKRELSTCGDIHVAVNMFGLKYAEEIISNSYNCQTIVVNAGASKDLVSELETIVDVYKELKKGKVTINPISDKKAMIGEYLNTHPIQTATGTLPVARQQIFYGAPGTGKSHGIESLIEEHHINKDTNVFRTTFHPDSDYSTFVGAYKPTKSSKIVRNVAGNVVIENGKEVKEDAITYKFVPQAFLKAYVKAWNRLDEPVILVIEEINRGNCAQIFGDLFQLLDRKDGVSEYPIKADDDLTRFLMEEKDVDGNDILINKEGIVNGELRLPANLYIWATMNTSDQSLFPIDSAFKRRWDWKYVKIAQGRDKDTKALLDWKVEFTYTDKEETKEYSCKWWDFIRAINEKVAAETSSDDKKLGFFFCKPNGDTIDAETFVGKVVFYLWNDVFKDNDTSIFNVGGKGEPSFDTFYTENEDGKTIVDTSALAAFMTNVFKGTEFAETETAE